MSAGSQTLFLDVGAHVFLPILRSRHARIYRINHTIDSATAMRLLVPVCDSTVLPEDLDAGDLALILMLLSIGTFIDTEPSQSLLTSEDYYALSRAVLYTGIDAAEGPELRIAQCLVMFHFLRIISSV